MRPKHAGDGGRQSLLLASLPSTDVARLRPYLRPVKALLKETVTKTGQPISRVLLPIDCVTSTLTELSEGESVEVGLMGAEGIVGLGLLYEERIATTTVIIQIPGNALEMSADDFLREVVEYGGDARRLFLRYANAFFGVVSVVAACNASHGLVERLARWTLLVHDRVGSDTFPLTHEFAALMLGVRRAGVSEAASVLRLAGAIDYQRGSVTVLDRAQLERASCACYDMITSALAMVFVGADGAPDADITLQPESPKYPFREPSKLPGREP